jgi:NAD(P)-dependent dehydrogenase (short-subunit alcohol dehydrogenase family)
MNSNKEKIIMVTGSNRGLGLGIAKDLISKGHKTIVCSRNIQNGQQVIDNLLEEFPNNKDNIFLCKLDITKPEEVESCAKWVKEKFGHIDVLVNNAGVSGGETEYHFSKLRESGEKLNLNTKSGKTSESVETFDTIFKTNVFGTMNLTETFLNEDLISRNGKIITIASSSGNATRLSNDELKRDLIADYVTNEKIMEYAARYRKAIENDKFVEDGWITDFVPVYSNSKLLLQVYNKALGKRKDVLERGIQVYDCCPGWVKTDMGSDLGPRTIDQGIKTPIYLIEIEHKIHPELQGKFFFNQKVFDWINSPVPDLST